MLFGQILELGHMQLEGGVGHHHVNAAERLQSRLDGMVAKGALGHIALQHDGAPSFGLDRLPRLFRVDVLVEVTDGDVGALAREQHRDRPTDARIGSRD